MENQNLLHKVLKLWFRQKSDGGLEAKLGYRFKDPELLAHALVHRSFLTGTDLPYVSNNERLEFLGDSVLNMLTTEYLYKTYPDDPEGELSKRKSAIVSGHACAQSSKEWSLSEYVKVGKAEEKLGGRGKESILADAYEAVLGAVYLDGGLEEVRAILNKFHFPRVQEIISAEDFINHKSELLEYLQGKLRTVRNMWWSMNRVRNTRRCSRSKFMSTVACMVAVRAVTRRRPNKKPLACRSKCC
jgi:ribonuclease III, bacterial